jgi:hypothetical protein
VRGGGQAVRRGHALIPDQRAGTTSVEAVLKPIRSQLREAARQLKDVAQAGLPLVVMLGETLDTLGVPDATSSNDEWRHVPLLSIETPGHGETTRADLERPAPSDSTVAGRAAPTAASPASTEKLVVRRRTVRSLLMALSG